MLSIKTNLRKNVSVKLKLSSNYELEKKIIKNNWWSLLFGLKSLRWTLSISISIWMVNTNPFAFFVVCYLWTLTFQLKQTNLLIMVNCIFLRMKGKCQRKKEYCEAPQISCTLHFSFKIPTRNKKLCIKSIIYIVITLPLFASLSGIDPYIISSRL